MREVEKDDPVSADQARLARLEHENDTLARAVLDLQRKLTIAEKREKTAEEYAQRVFKVAESWRADWREQFLKAKNGLQRALDVAAMWKSRQRRGLATVAAARERLLPLTYFPAGEEPEARWGLTELGQRALAAGTVKGPEWTLLISPDPRDVLSIEVRSGSRQETVYRTAGYVSTSEPQAGGHFLGLLEAFVEISKGEDEALGRAMHALEGLFLCGVHEMAAQWLERAQARVDALLNAMEERPAEDLDAVDREHQAIEEAFGEWIKPRDPEAVKRAWDARPQAAAPFPAQTEERRDEGFYAGEGWPKGLREALEKHDPTQALAGKNPATLDYDLGAVCARCGVAYQQHLGLGSQNLPCDGFLAVAEPPDWARAVQFLAGRRGGRDGELAETPGDFAESDNFDDDEAREP